MSTAPSSARSAEMSVFDTAEWNAAWARNSVERIEVLEQDDPALYLTHHSPFWQGYEVDVGVGPTWDDPVVTVGTVYSFFGPVALAADPDRVATVLARAKAQAERASASGVLVLNLPPEAAAGWSGVEQPDLSIRLDAAYHRLPGEGGEDAVVGAVPKRVRTDWRRRWRRATEQGMRLVESTEPTVEQVDEVVALANGSAQRHGWVPIYDRDSTLALLEVPGARLIRAVADGVTVAGFIAFEHQRCLYLWAGGTSPDLFRDVSPYLFLLYELLVQQAESRWDRIEFGRGNDAFKRKYGFTGVELWSLWYPTDERTAARYRQKLSTLHAGLTECMGL